MADETYNNQKVYRKQDAEEFVVADGGLFNVESGGAFLYVDTEVASEILELMFLSPNTVTQWGSASATGTISPAYGFHVFEAGTTVSKLSMTIPEASKGAMLYLNGFYVAGDGNVSFLTVSATGKVINQRGSDLSSFELSALGFVKMNCMADATWTVVEFSEINEHASS